jgi:cytochrome d ubiquinol oxidase subunit I
MFVPVTQVIFAELSGRLAFIFQKRCNGRIFNLHAFVCTRQPNFGEPGAEHGLPHDEGRPAGSTRLFGIVVGEHNAFLGNPVDVGRLVSRIQFAANISFHILFPTITIALGWVLFFFRVRFAQTGDDKWMAAYRFWVKIFALSFAMGVVSGITMSFQFGTNWPGFMETVGNIAGPLLAYEVLTAFFLEAVFIGIMLFGFSRVPGWLHMLATFLVAFGTTMSAFWIIVLNSWMHTPQGFEMIDGVGLCHRWWAIIFNPSMPYRFAHMMLASGLTVSFLILGISAFRWLIGD